MPRSLHFLSGGGGGCARMCPQAPPGICLHEEVAPERAEETPASRPGAPGAGSARVCQALGDVFQEAISSAVAPGPGGGGSQGSWEVCKLRGSGTAWPRSAQFTVMGLALTCPSPFCPATDFMTIKPWCRPLLVNFPDVLGEERHIYKVASTCALIKTQLNFY